MSIEKIERKSKFAINKSCVYVSDNMSNKMFGFPSISTSCLANPICLARMKDGNSICSHCFAKGTISMYHKYLKPNLEYNYSLLTKEVIDLDELPCFKFDVDMLRIESFGDIATPIQALNYFDITKVNPSVNVGWWTKNIEILEQGFDLFGEEKPSNLQVLYSCKDLNCEDPQAFTEKIKAEHPLVDKVFFVYDKPTIAKRGLKVNCGARDCLKCRRCYMNNGEDIIIEELK